MKIFNFLLDLPSLSIDLSFYLLILFISHSSFSSFLFSFPFSFLLSLFLPFFFFFLICWTSEQFQPLFVDLDNTLPSPHQLLSSVTVTCSSSSISNSISPLFCFQPQLLMDAILNCMPPISSVLDPILVVITLGRRWQIFISIHCTWLLNLLILFSILKLEKLNKSSHSYLSIFFFIHLHAHTHTHMHAWVEVLKNSIP